MDKQEIARRVREQYEKYPYPTPDGDLAPFLEGRTAEVGFPAYFYHLMWPYAAPRTDLDILIAGCGTSQTARYAAAHPDARITAVDVSQACLDQTRRQLDRHRLDNVELKRMALEELPTADERYDFIVCTGVIHHLPDPRAGLEALRDVLKPAGSMYLMVYAPCGRDAIYLLQDLFARLGVDAASVSEEQLAALRHIVGNLPEGHPLHFRRRLFPDLFKDAELIDYVLNAHDRAHAIDALYQLLGAAGLSVQHLINRAHYSVEPLIRAGHFEALHALSEPERLAVGELLRGGLFKHELFGCRSDRDPATRVIDFTTLPPERTVPWRSPSLDLQYTSDDDGTVIRAGSDSHHFSDLKFPLDRARAKILNAIDGQRSLADIHARLKHHGEPLTIEQLAAECQAFFEQDLVFPRAGYIVR